jgi:hypothetical protein
MYRISSIEKVDQPGPGASGHWYRYVISNNHGNTITGQRAGTRKEVTRFVQDCVHHLNQKYRFSSRSTTATVRKVNVDGLVPFYR